MNTRRNRFVALLAAVTMTFGSLALASAEEPVLEPATETLYISAGCPASTPGTCTSTRWLGKTKGDATSNFLTSTLPVDEVLYHAEGEPNWRDYASNDSLRPEGYALRSDAPLVQAVTLESDGPGVQTTVHAKIDAVTESGEDVSFGPLVQTVNMLPASRQTLTFSFDIPSELEGVALDSMTAWVAVRGVNLSAGAIDQQGGSTVTIPYWVPVEVAPAPTPAP